MTTAAATSTAAAAALVNPGPAGRAHLSNLIGGVAAYQATGHPLVVDEAPAQLKEIHA